MWPAKERTQRGFTLVEVMLALSLGGLALLSASMLMQQLADSGTRIAASSIALDRADNGERALRALVAHFEPSGDAGAFTGSAGKVVFNTWCDSPSGWKERCLAELSLDTLSNGVALTATLGAHQRVTLRDSLHLGRLLYLRDAENGGTWSSSWGPSAAGPLAIGLTLSRDTMILRIGERR